MNSTLLKDIVESMFEALNDGDYGAFLSYFDEDLVFIHSEGTLNKQQLTKFYNRIDSIFIDNHHMIERIIVEENTVVVDCTWSGTHIGVYNGIKPSNRYFEIPAVWLFNFHEGNVGYAKRLVDNHIFTRLVHMESFDKIIDYVASSRPGNR